VWELYRKGGIYASPASNEVGPGIATVARYLRATLEDSPSHPKVLISKNCKQLIDGILNYIFHEMTIKKEIDAPDKPRKYQDDMVDAFRYLLATKPQYHHQTFDGDEYQPVKKLKNRSKLPQARFYG